MSTIPPNKWISQKISPTNDFAALYTGATFLTWLNANWTWTGTWSAGLTVVCSDGTFVFIAVYATS